jgi:crossover junction endodeoxyribonuclease RuvC
VRIIGIDPGLQATGWGVIAAEGAQLKDIDHGIFRTTTRMGDPDRLNLIFEGLRDVIKRHQPNKAVIEEIFVKDNPRSALRLGLARGVAVLACGQAGLALSEISARKVKQAVTGTGTADKKQVANMVSHLLGIPAPPSDAADALAMAIACYQGAAAKPFTAAQVQGGLSAAINAALQKERQKT